MVFKCIDSCGKCCGPILFTREEWEKHRYLLPPCVYIDYIGDRIVPQTEKCPFLTKEKQCMIYDDRPEVCRLFGVDERLPCPYLKPNGKPRSKASQKQVERMQNKKLDLLIKKAEEELSLKQLRENKSNNGNKN